MRAGWESRLLGDLLQIRNGYAFSSKQFTKSDEGMPLIRIRDLDSGTETETHYTGNYDSKYLIASGNMLIGMDGEFRCYIWRGPDALLNQRVCKLEHFSDSLLPRFFFHGINKYLKEIEDVTGYTTVKHLSSSSIKAINFPLRSLPEQERIVAILDEAFAAIATATAHAERNLANAKELFQSVVNGIFNGEASGFSERRLPDLCRNVDNQRIPITKSRRVPGAVPYYGSSGVVDRVEDKLFDEDLLLVSEDGANLLARTYPIAFSISGPAWVNNHAHVLRFDSRTNQTLVEFYLNSISLEPFVSGMAQPKLNQKKLNSIPIPWPKDSGVIQRIVEQLESMTALSAELVERYSEKVNGLTTLKQSLLQNAFTGELTANNKAADRTLAEAGV